MLLILAAAIGLTTTPSNTTAAAGDGWRERPKQRSIAFSSEVGPVRVKKTCQSKRLEPGSDSIRTEQALSRFLPLARFGLSPEVLFLAAPCKHGSIGHRKQIAFHRQQRVRSGLQLLPVNSAGYFFVEFIGLLAKLLKETACLLGDIDTLYPAVDRVCLPDNEAGRFKTINQRPHANLTDIELVGELGLGKSVLPRDERQHPPLRPRYSERRQCTVEHHPPQPGNIVDEISQSQIPFGPVDHARFSFVTSVEAIAAPIGRLAVISYTSVFLKDRRNAGGGRGKAQHRTRYNCTNWPV